MTDLILSSNFVGNKLPGVGEVSLQNGKIQITTEPDATATLLRGANKIVLLKPSERQSVISGAVSLGDVYTLANGDQKLIVKVEEESTKHDTDLYINPDPVVDATSSKRRTTLTVGVLILVLLIVSVVFGVKQKNSKEFNTKSEEKLNTAISNYETMTRDSFVTAKELAFQLKHDGYKNSKLDELLKNISEKEADILGEVKPEVKELLDLTLQINGFNGSKLVSTAEDVFTFDEKEKNIIQLDIKGKNAKIVAKKDVLEGVINIASYEDRLFTLNNDGIYVIDNERKKVKDLDWGNSIFYVYSGNIYLVDKTNNQIYRFSGNGSSFGNKTEWLAPGIEADFSKVIDMSIDGSIWLLSSTGKVTRFTNGNPTSITMDGIVTPLSNPTAIYTNENLKYVYILDKSDGRVVVLDKNGKLKVQYLSDKFKETTDLIASEEEGRVILLSGSKLVYFDLKQ